MRPLQTGSYINVVQLAERDTSHQVPEFSQLAGRMKLTYFNLKGRAELARLILAQAEVAYSDCRISKEEWQSLKPSKSVSQF